MKLLVIGNGFDIAHGVDTNYKCFREFLINKLESLTKIDYSSYDFKEDDILTCDFNPNEVNNLRVILYFISWVEKDAEWKTLEKSIGEFDYSLLNDIFVDKSDVDGEEQENGINFNLVEPYKDALLKIGEYFREWILGIDISKTTPIKKIVDLVVDTLVLSFNYTSTLESLYKVKSDNICYIHGCARNKDDLHFGHGNTKDHEDFQDEIINLNYLSVADTYDFINKILRKNVKDNLLKNKRFFSKLDKITEVYSIGFSYGEVDHPYIKEIINRAVSLSKWNINSYPSSDEKLGFIEVIRNCGFKGNFNEFD